MPNIVPPPAPQLTDEQMVKRQEERRRERKAEFIRETSAKVLVELIAGSPKSPAICAVISVDAAELLAKTLENKGYL